MKTDSSIIPNGSKKEVTMTQRRHLALTMIGLITLPSFLAALPVYGTRIREYFAITGEQFGTLMGMRNLGRIPAMITVGPLIARLGVRQLAEFSTIGVGLAFLILGVGGSLFSFYVSMSATGLFQGWFNTAIPIFLIALFPTNKRQIFSVMLVSLSATGILMPLLANQLLKWSVNHGDPGFATILQMPFVISGGTMLLVGLLLVVMQKGSFQNDFEKPHRIRLSTLLRLRPVVIALLLSLHAASDNTLHSFLPMFMEEHFEQLPLAAAWAVSGHGLAYVITRTVLSLWPEGLGHRKILSLVGPLGGTIVILTLWFGSATSVPILYTLASLLFAAEYPVLVSEISSKSTGEFGSILGGGHLVGDILTFTLLKGTGRIADRTNDYRIALTVAACGFIAFGLIATLAGLGIRPRAKNSSSR